jgi:ribosome-binding ATPase
MGISCGFIGLPSSGKTVIYNAITSAGVTGFGGSDMNRMVVNVPDLRMDKLVEMYHPRKIVPATLEVVDIPGLKANPQGKARSSQLLAHIKNMEAILHVVRCFEDAGVPFEYETIDPKRDVELIDLEMMAADSTTLENKLIRLEKKLKAGDKDAARETAHCKKIYDAIQQGIPARRQGLSAEEMVSVYECNLVSQKPVLYIANIKSIVDVENRHVKALQEIAKAENAEMITICGKDEADISQLEPDEQKIFLQELGLTESSMGRLIRAAYRLLGLINFFTVGEDEVRAWMCKKGDKAPVAAGKIHKDMEKGFIRMEVMKYDDLIELGSENALVKAGKKRVESREYEVIDGDIVMVLFNATK